MLSSGANVTIWDEMLSSGTKCYHLGWNVIIWDEIISSGTKCYHLGWNVIIWDFTSSAGIGPFISVISRYETVDNNKTERKVAGCTL